MQLTDIEQKFILHWGEMGNRWGINRTVAQIHALLYLAPEAMNAEQIAETLSVARSNVSNSLRELQGWRIIKIVHQLGDRRDHFESFTDPWELFEIILEERKRREIDPTIEVVSACIREARKNETENAHTLKRLEDLDEFIQTMVNLYEHTSKLPSPAIKKLARMGSGLQAMLGIKR
ncbi:MAG: DNA-binding transcriptional regulator GbsR (MarR family) [Candidatus Promineifilaceae bacterium]|jgi:DNA-binding transcriptional regulator GbsR (MarR family)